MKTLVSFLFVFVAFNAICQSDNSKILEQRAKDFHNAISKNDKDVWRNYMKENFTPALIERPMRARVATTESDGNSNSTTNSETKIDAKLSMFEQLHGDFGNSKLSSVEVSGKKIEMVLNSTNGMKGVFSFEVEEKSPWKIDKMGIEVKAEN